MSPGHHRLNVIVMHSRPLIAMGAATALSQHRQLDVHSQDPDTPRVDEEADVVVADYHTAMRILEPATPGAFQSRRTRVAVLTNRQRPSDIETALRTGVHAYVLVGCAVEELVNGVQLAAQGARFLCNKAAQQVADGLSCEPFTERQREVLDLLARGMPNKSIARTLGVSEGTIKSHVKALLSKLGAQSRTEAMSIAIRRGVVASPS